MEQPGQKYCKEMGRHWWIVVVAPMKWWLGTVCGESLSGPTATAVTGETSTGLIRAKPPEAARTSQALPASVYFASGSATLSSNAREALRAIGNGLIGVPYVIEVTGYSDASGDEAKNRALAGERAKAVREALLAAGVKADLVRLAAPRDVVGGRDAEKSRRVDIAFAVR